MSLLALLAVLYLHVDGVATKPTKVTHANVVERIGPSLQSAKDLHVDHAGHLVARSGPFLRRHSVAEKFTDMNLALLRALASADVVDVHYNPETLDILNVKSIPAESSSQRDVHTPYSVESLRDGIKGLRAYFSSTDSSLGDSRTSYMLKQCKELGIKCTRLVPVTRGSKDFELNTKLMFALRVFLDSDPSDISLYVEDDATFINDFEMNLRESVIELPRAWTVFHLGGGFLHDRPHHSTSFDLTLAGDLEGNPRTSIGGRIFFDWPHAAITDSVCCSNEKGVLAGGPVGMLIKKIGARQIQKALVEETASNASAPDDVILRNVGVVNPGTHFMARQPQLCIERWD